MMTVFLNGCNEKFDLEKAQKFAEIAKEYEEQYPIIVKDIYQSCLRSARYSIPQFDSQAQDTIRAKMENTCLTYAFYEERLLEYHTFLKDYTETLRKLASNEVVQLKGPGQLASALATLPIPQLQAISPILDPIITRVVDRIAEAAANEYRVGVLSNVMTDVNSDIQIYIERLAELTDEIYRKRLEEEQNKLDTYFAQGISQDLDGFDDQNSPQARLNVYLVDERWQAAKREAQINKKLYELHVYLNNLKKMADLHQEIYADLNFSK